MIRMLDRRPPASFRDANSTDRRQSIDFRRRRAIAPRQAFPVARRRNRGRQFGMIGGRGSSRGKKVVPTPSRCDSDSCAMNPIGATAREP
jgi:hypothetical protein